MDRDSALAISLRTRPFWGTEYVLGRIQSRAWWETKFLSDRKESSQPWKRSSLKSISSATFLQTCSLGLESASQRMMNSDKWPREKLSTTDQRGNPPKTCCMVSALIVLQFLGTFMPKVLQLFLIISTTYFSRYLSISFASPFVKFLLLHSCFEWRKFDDSRKWSVWGYLLQ